MLLLKQECIPVGCVPAARRPYAEVCFWGGGCLLRGGSAPGGLLWGVSAPGGGWGGSAPGGSAPGGGGVCILGCTEAETPQPPCKQNHTHL